MLLHYILPLSDSQAGHKESENLYRTLRYTLHATSQIATENIIIMFYPAGLVAFSRHVSKAGHVINWWSRFQNQHAGTQGHYIGYNRGAAASRPVQGGVSVRSQAAVENMIVMFSPRILVTLSRPTLNARHIFSG